MKKMNVNERIEALRQLMAERNIDVYYVPNEDDHLSEEYTAAHFQCKSFLSGFSGDSGTVVVTKDFAGLWTDGRYFTQAEHELAGTCVTLMRMRQEGVPPVGRFALDHTPEGGIMAFDGHVVSAEEAMFFARSLAMKHAHVKMNEDLTDLIWKDRPAMPKEKTFLLGTEYTGEAAADKIADMRKLIEARKADALLLTQLEDPCWLLNIRGNDIPCTPVPYAYALIGMDYVNYYIDPVQVDDGVKAQLEQAGVTLRPYEAVEDDLKAMKHQIVWTDLNKINACLYESLSGGQNEVISSASPVEMRRSCKNETEIRNTKEAHVVDGVAMVKFIKWLKDNAADPEMSELKAQNRLYELRAEGKDYIEPSFDTIAAYGPNASMMHYTATEKKYDMIRPEGFLLVDSGGTYKLGSTDITRTIAMGPLTEEEKKYYTLVLKGHLALAHARFLYGTCGNNLDILARGPLWNLDIDYQCGTGHGVGYALSVHEGPQGVRWGMPSASRPSAVLEEGMVVTDEPGVYLPEKMGIRIENELLTVKGTKNFYGQWMHFENLTWCPYEREAIDPKYLDDETLGWINSYHKEVYEVLSPYLNEEEKNWLAGATAEIRR
jgi:Xaa-Pro aminopeptidase